jgi:hypothetical protein
MLVHQNVFVFVQSPNPTSKDCVLLAIPTANGKQSFQCMNRIYNTWNMLHADHKLLIHDPLVTDGIIQVCDCKLLHLRQITPWVSISTFDWMRLHGYVIITLHNAQQVLKDKSKLVIFDVDEHTGSVVICAALEELISRIGNIMKVLIQKKPCHLHLTPPPPAPNTYNV